MKFFVDTADVAEIAELAETGLLDGVTTNPTLIARSKRDFLTVVREICALVGGPVSAEVAATDLEGMIREGEIIAGLASNVAVKLPLTWAGLKACRHFSRQSVMVNLTLCFSVPQAILAAKAGAAFVSPFVGRLDDVGQDGMSLIRGICAVYQNYPAFTTEVLVASIRNPVHLVQAALAGAEVATLPPLVLKQLVQHPLTDKGLQAFVSDWQSTGQTISASKA